MWGFNRLCFSFVEFFLKAQVSRLLKHRTGVLASISPSLKNNVREKLIKLFETRTEVLCNKCDARLGYLFDDRQELTEKYITLQNIKIIRLIFHFTVIT